MLSRRIGAVGLAAVVAGCVVVLGCGPSKAPDYSKVDFAPEVAQAGPQGDDFNSTSFAIVRVLRQPKRLSAFGYASLYDDTREVGRMDEGQKELPAEKQGERIVFSWKYRGDEAASAAARIELYHLRDTEPVVIEEAYPSLERGCYRIAYNNRGASYTGRGPVTRWQFRILSGGRIMAQKQSNLWGAMTSELAAGE